MHVAALLLSDDIDALRECMANSLGGALVDDEMVRDGFARYWQGPFGWKTDEGYCPATLETWLLLIRGLTALLEEDTEASCSALRAWLPPPAALLRFTEYEVAWLNLALGANHPALLCARLHGERLGDWKATADVAGGVLCIEQFNPLLRTEAYRLLGRAKAALGERALACMAAECAATEAAGAKYVWLEMLSLRDLLRWCELSEADNVRVRLRGVVGRVAATDEELMGVLGDEGVL